MTPRKPFARLNWDGRSLDRPATQPAELVERVRVLSGDEDSGPGAAGELIQGDNLTVMAGLMNRYQGRIDLIYVDPPFLSGRAYSARVGRGEDSRQPGEWQTIQGYTDMWRDGADYLRMLYPRLAMMVDLLSPTGSLYLHLDWHASAYARVILDELLGPDRLLNEIIWVYHGPSPIRSAFNRKHDTILVYTKSSRYTFNADAVRIPYNDSTRKTFAASRKAGFGKQPDLDRGKVPEDWWYFPVVARLHRERTGYPTQKPEALLERVILASSRPGDLVADFFCGSGTTPVVAARLGRQWVAVDQAALAIQTTYRRLLLEAGRGPFGLWAADGPASQEPLRAVFDLADRGSAIRLTGIQGSHSPQAFPDNVVTWEIDPSYDGRTFISRQHVVRGWNQESMPLKLGLPGRLPNSRLAVRVTDSVGASGVSVADSPASSA